MFVHVIIMTRCGSGGCPKRVAFVFCVVRAMTVTMTMVVSSCGEEEKEKCMRLENDGRVLYFRFTHCREYF